MTDPLPTNAPDQRSPYRDGGPRPTLIEVRGVTKKFEQEENVVDVLKGIDLEVAQGEMLAIQGRSGAGKSTLLHILGTLDLPTAGSVKYLGQEVTRYNSAQLAAFRNETIGFVFQFHHLLPEFDALENVMMPGLVQGRPRGELRKRALELLEMVRLSHRIDHRPGELSGGEQQRVALARALVMQPKVILADEPTGNLDSTTSDAMFKLFFDLNREIGTTFCIVTHSDDLAARLPRKVTMRDGRIESDDWRADAAAGDTTTAPSDPETPDSPSTGAAPAETAPPEAADDAPQAPEGEEAHDEARP